MDQNDPVRNLPLVTPPEPGEKPAARWQIVLTAIAAVAIVVVFLWGINNQRGENSGEETAATQPTPVTPQTTDSQNPPQQAGQQQQGSGNAPTTTGQGANDQSNASQGGQGGSPNAKQPPTNPDQNGQPSQNNGQPAQPGAGGRYPRTE